MKRLLLVILSLVTVVVLDTTGSGLLRAYTAAVEPSCSGTASTPIATPAVPRTGDVTVDGCITIWSNAPGFNGPKVKPFHTSAKLVQDSAHRNWGITIADLSVPWSSKTQLTLQDGKVASGVLLPSTNSVNLTIPLKGVPLINTITFDVSTDSSVTTTDNQNISGRRVDPKGDITLVGSKSRIGLFYQAQVRIQCKLSPWPLA